MATIDQEKLKSLFALLPPLAEQQDIVKYVDNSLRKIDLMSRAVEKVITKVEEYHTALITAAVTGKIDVRSIDIPSQEAA
jgi:restriction endonuclease S subunit